MAQTFTENTRELAVIEDTLFTFTHCGLDIEGCVLGRVPVGARFARMPPLALAAVRHLMRVTSCLLS